MDSGTRHCERLECGRGVGRRALFETEPEHNVAHRRRYRFDSHVTLGHGVLILHTIAQYDADVVIARYERNPVLIGERRAVQGLHLTSRKLDVAFLVVGEDEVTSPVPNFEVHVDGRVELGLLGVRFDGEIREIELNGVVQKRRGVRAQQDRKRAPGRHEIERVVGRHPVAVQEPAVEVVRIHRTRRRLLDPCHDHLGPEGGGGHIGPVDGLAQIERERRSRELGRDAIDIVEGQLGLRRPPVPAGAGPDRRGRVSRGESCRRLEACRTASYRTEGGPVPDCLDRTKALR